MSVTINAKGTSVPYFRLGKSGITLYQGPSDPSGSYTIQNGDVWFDTSASTIKVRSSSVWVQPTLDDLNITGSTLSSSSGNDLILDSASGKNVVIDGQKFPNADGLSGQVLSTNGSGVLSWISAGGTGTVTSVAVSGNNGIGVSGSPITTNGTISLSLGAITPTSVAATGTVTGSNLSGTNTGDQTITLTGDITGSGTGSFATTLATVNSSPQTDTFRKITVNGKGLVTATSAVGLSDITTALGYTPVNKAGDTMTGNLTISKSSTSSYIFLTAPSGNAKAVVMQTAGGGNRWFVGADNTPETGSNAGSDYVIFRYDDAGADLTTPFRITRSTGLTTLSSLSVTGTMTGTLTGSSSLNVLKAGDTMTGQLLISYASPNLVVNATSGPSSIVLSQSASGTGNGNFIQLRTQSSVRWLFGSNTVPETGSNAGTDFIIQRFSDSGTFIDQPLTITRSTGNIVATGNIYAAGFVGNVTGSSSLNVLKSGDTMTGPLVLNADPTTNLQAATKQYVDTQVVAASSGPSIVVVSTTSQAAVAQVQYVLTNTSAATTVTLPANPTSGDIVWITNVTGRTDCVIANNGKLLMGLLQNMTIDALNVTVQLRFINNTIGWRVI